VRVEPPEQQNFEEQLSELVEGVLSGSRLHVAKAITLIESGERLGDLLLSKLRGRVRGIPVIGFAGPPGAGKSTLIASLVNVLKGRGKPVAVLAVDPSSPISGGAVLGDRVRLVGKVDQSGIYFRSLASRGASGAIARNLRAMCRVLDAAGFEAVMVETVGAGQSDVEIMGVADIVVVVVPPDYGDSIQAVKAGLLEIGDLYVVSKSDLPNARLMASVLESLLSGRNRRVKVLTVSAATGENVSALVDLIWAELDAMRSSGELEERRLRIYEWEMREVMMERVRRLMESALTEDGYLDEARKALASGADPRELGARLAEEVLKSALRRIELRGKKSQSSPT
jgi:LAO/AO transport system kinase